VVTILFFALSVLAPAPRQDAPAATVTLTEGSAPPDAQVVLPLALSVREGTRVGEVEIRVGFPGTLLSFVSIERSGLAVAADAELRSEVGKGSSEGTSVLHATISTAGKSRQPLPDGPIAYVTFRIAKEAKPGSSIPLGHEATVRAPDGGAVAPVVATPAEVKVSEAPPPACVFYMH
jgi:hypothetical protein